MWAKVKHGEPEYVLKIKSRGRKKRSSHSQYLYRHAILWYLPRLQLRQKCEYTYTTCLRGESFSFAHAWINRYTIVWSSAVSSEDTPIYTNFFYIKVFTYLETIRGVEPILGVMGPEAGVHPPHTYGQLKVSSSIPKVHVFGDGSELRTFCLWGDSENHQNIVQ